MGRSLLEVTASVKLECCDSCDLPFNAPERISEQALSNVTSRENVPNGYLFSNGQPFVSCLNEQRYRLNRSRYLFQKISISSNGSSYPFQKNGIRLNGLSYPFKKISIHLNGSSYLFKKFVSGSQGLSYSFKSAVRTARAIRSKKLLAFGTVRAVLFKKIYQPFQLSVGKTTVTSSFHWKVKCCE